MPSPNNHTSPTALATAAGVAWAVTDALALAEAAAAEVDFDAPTSRRTTPNSAHANGASAGAPGPPLKACAANAARTETVTGTVDAAGTDGTPAAADAELAGFDLPDRADLGPVFAAAADRGPAEGPEVTLDPESAPAPVVSADATHCIDATAVPKPTATATAPTPAHRLRPDSARRREPLLQSHALDEFIRSPPLEHRIA
ncbi:MAG: hypothetical protein ACOYB7_12770 [Mycobacterium sp.]